MTTKHRTGSGEEQGSGSPPCLPTTAIGLAETNPLVLVAGRRLATKAEGPTPPPREAVVSARLAQRLAEIERAGGWVAAMERKPGSATWLLTVVGLDERKEPHDQGERVDV